MFKGDFADMCAGKFCWCRWGAKRRVSVHRPRSEDPNWILYSYSGNWHSLLCRISFKHWITFFKFPLALHWILPAFTDTTAWIPVSEATCFLFNYLAKIHEYWSYIQEIACKPLFPLVTLICIFVYLHYLGGYYSNHFIWIIFFIHSTLL
jgi:hypothetical protein